MSKILSLGAINKLTGEYVYPKIANKIDEYICSECGKDLILCQGNIRAHHFRHKADTIVPCHHYSNPGESQIHKHAKLLFKTLLESKIHIEFVRSCSECKKNEEYEIPETSETSVIKMEYRFEFNGPKVADVAYIDNDEIVCIFEICNTHTTSSENRPEPWFEIDAETLIRTANDNKLSSLQIPCIRSEKCEECLEIENSNLKVHNIEKYVRLKLGQTIFPTPRRKKCENPSVCLQLLEFTTTILDDCEVCDNCKYNEWLHQAWKEVHLRIDFDAQENVTKNKKILDLFRTDFANKHVVIHTHKGSAVAYIISDSNYKKYDYWKECLGKRWSLEMRFPTEHIIDITRKGTIEIIIELIEYCRRIGQEKRQPQYSDDAAGDENDDDWVIEWYDNNQKTVTKNTRYLIRQLDREKIVYLNVEFSQKDIIKKMGGKWNKEHKLWYILYDTYKKYEKKLIMFKVNWNCKDCEDMKKNGEEGDCEWCLNELIGWIN